nr:MAG: ORF1 [TTV-like mini virus]
MPWWRRRRWFRPYRRYWRRPRKAIRRRYYRRRWVRKKKLKKLYITQYQPNSIRKCKIIGPCCLFATTRDRIGNDFDLYEYSTVPERLPGGGGWGIKVFSLSSLYSDHEYARNCWTRDNHNYPLVRYLGCRLTFYQAEYVDYIVTYTNQLPMLSSLGMYNSMQPNIQYLQQNKLIIPGTKTYKKHKPFKKVWIPPPKPLQNKWYFQQDLAKTPLLMLRTTTTSMNKYFIDPNSQSNCITIKSLNTSIFQNRNFANPPGGTKPGYWAYTDRNSNKIYLYSTTTEPPPTKPTLGELIPLYDTKNYTEGREYKEVQPTQYNSNTWSDIWKTTWQNYNGNPFHTIYLQNNLVVYQCPKHYTDLTNNWTNNPKTQAEGMSIVNLIKDIRYCPNLDQTHDHLCYFMCNKKDEYGWKEPEDNELYNEGLPYWLLLWGFADWHRKIKKHQHIDSDYILCIKQHVNLLTKDYVVPLSYSFIEGRSPYFKDTPYRSEIDEKTWYPQLQFQNEAINEILLTGPGVPKLPDNYSVQGLMHYKFYFKWGGDLPQMSTIENPKEIPSFTMPGNQYSTNSLQNPTTNAEALLYSFDERRHTLTKKALRRLQTYEPTKEYSITDGSPYQDQPQIQTPQEETDSSEEEETQTLFEQLQRQRNKQKQLRQRILLTLQKLQKSE